MAGALAKINQTIHVASGKHHSRPSLPYRRPMMVCMSQNKSYWAFIHEDIESHLKQAIPLREPVQVFEPMRHFVFTSPPSTAPALCIAACELVGGHRDRAVAAASALHVMHASAYTHEQLPLSDRPRVVPTSRPIAHHVYNPNVELLLPDGIVPFGLELLARSDDPAQNNSGRILRVMIEMTRAFGSQEMVDGQYKEILCSQLDDKDPRYAELINYTCEKKEGGLHSCGAASGAILGGGSEEEIEKLRRYGFYMGMIQGISQRLIPNQSKKIEEFKNLALEELKGFNNEANIEAISSFINVNYSHV
uniref:Heterodimeric geranylgeranyl pyrophosphate synthase small subunit, chloroplastic n=1 Tax=Pistacia terebinthus subsp. palaestina TaxID=434239 RepID=A0A8F2ZG49_9ROSI|nr:heterodimeric geranylgeranyl pyrophosphate synthase small subunit, chloroplastic [Pistacia terebinthus subsp. palaestina]